MASLRSDRIDLPVGIRERRVLAWMRSEAADALAGRTVWSVAALADGHRAGRRLCELLRRDVSIAHLSAEPAEPPAELARGLEAMLAGIPSPRPLGAAERSAYTHGAKLAERTVGGKVVPGDVVVLQDCFTVSFAAALRQRGAHAIWHLRRRSGEPCVRAAIDFIDRVGGAAVDAVVIDERRGTGGEERIAAFIPAAHLLDVREASPGVGAAPAERRALAWASLLGDIVDEDRLDHVGGTIRVRPVVAPR